MKKYLLTAAIAAIGMVSLSGAPTYATDTTECVNGSQAGNYRVVWSDDGASVTLATKNGKPVCDDVHMFLSSYTMPKQYDGRPFIVNDGVNKTAVPQALFASKAITLQKGDSTETWTIAVPKACENKQVDVYYGPELQNVTADEHHGSHGYISGIIVRKTEAACVTAQEPQTPPVVEEEPVVVDLEPTTPKEEKAEAVVATPAPVAELPRTGAAAMPLFGALMLAGATYGIAIRRK